MTSVDGRRECNLGGGGIRDELNPGEVPAGVHARVARGTELEEEVDGRDTFDPAVNGPLEESRRDLAVVGDIGGKGYSYGPEGSILYGVPTN